jgi:predicted amidohydrolase
MTTVLDRDRSRLLGAIEAEASDPSLHRFRVVADQLGIYLHIGSMPIRLAADAAANRSFLIAPTGAILARYDKIHMFDADPADGETYRESQLYRPGTAAVVADMDWARLGLTICYDVRFPHLYQSLAESEASVIAVPSAFTRTTGEAHWHVLLRARAIETGAFVIAAAQAGAHADGRETYGHSMIVDPWGTILAEAAREPGFILADVDPDLSVAARRRIPVLAHHRPYAPAAAARLKSVS